MLFSNLESLAKQGTSPLFNSKPEAVFPTFELSVPPPKISGDLATNLPLLVARSLSAAPKLIAENIIKNIPQNELIEKVEIAGAGFLNFILKEKAFLLELESLLAPQPLRQLNRGRILIEFVSANPTGPLHIGHGRGAALGDSLVRIFRAIGYEVTAEFYVNDSGGQIRNLGFSMEARVRELKGEPANFPEKGYLGSYVIDYAKEAIESKKTFKPITADQMIFDESDLAGFASVRNLERIKKDLNDFAVHFDTWYPESALHKKNAVPELFIKLKDKNLAYENEGALWFRSSDYGDDKDRVLQKSSEAPTYFASDMAYHEDKFSRGFDRYINIWGADHHSYAIRLKACLGAMGYSADKLNVILNQLVSIKGGRLSKRAGDMISLAEVIEEVGRDATRFFFALRSPGAHFEFDLDLAKKQASDNPVFYVQYVHARCASLFVETEKRGIKSEPLSWKARESEIKLDPTEKAVLLHLASFEKVLELCAKDMSNHHLTGYLQELAGKYHSFYEKCRILDEGEVLRSFRLDLVRAIKKRVAQGLDLLGVSAPERL